MASITVEPPTSNVIDFEALMRAERAKAAVATKELKACKVSDVYNGMQRSPGQGARIICLDVRPHDQWAACRIRDAESIVVKYDEVHVVEVSGSTSPFTCRGDIIAVLVDQSSNRDTGGSEAQRLVAQHLESTGAKKVFILDGGFDAFRSAYPFLCVGDSIPEAAALQAVVSWPAEIIPGRFYLGVRTHAANQHQLKALGVELIIDLSEGSAPMGGAVEEEVVEHPDGTRTITLVPTGPDDGISRVYFPTRNDPETRVPLFEGLEAIAGGSKKGVVLVVCGDGVSLGPALAVAHVMRTSRIPHMQALAYVIKRKRDAAPHAGAYVQLQELQAELGLR